MTDSETTVLVTLYILVLRYYRYIFSQVNTERQNVSMMGLPSILISTLAAKKKPVGPEGTPWSKYLPTVSV